MIKYIILLIFFFPIYSETLQWSKETEGKFVLKKDAGLYSSPDFLEWNSSDSLVYKIKWKSSGAEIRSSDKKHFSRNIPAGLYGGGHRIRSVSTKSWKIWEIELMLPTNGDPPSDFLYVAENSRQIFILGKRGRGLFGLKENAGLHLFFLSEPQEENAAGLFRIHYWQIGNRIKYSRFWLFGLDGGMGLIAGNTPCSTLEKAVQYYGWEVMTAYERGMNLKGRPEQKEIKSVLDGILQDDWTQKISHYWTDFYHMYGWTWSKEWSGKRTFRTMIPAHQAVNDQSVEFSREFSVLEYDGRKLSDVSLGASAESGTSDSLGDNVWAVIGRDEEGLKIRSIIAKPKNRFVQDPKTGFLQIKKREPGTVRRCGMQ